VILKTTGLWSEKKIKNKKSVCYTQKYPNKGPNQECDHTDEWGKLHIVKNQINQ